MTPHRRHIDAMNERHGVQFAPKLVAAPNVKYVLAATAEAAETIAIEIACGRVPDLYLFGCDCLRAWRESGLVEQRRYQPWAVTFHGAPDSLLVGSTRRIGRL